MAAADSTSDLLLPGAQPPVSHFGATLLRHVVVTGLRYTLYHLGLPLPDRAPLRIERLRLSLDAAALTELLASTAEGRAVCGALTDPGGSAESDEAEPSGAAFFHRLRLGWVRRRDLRRPTVPDNTSVSGLEYHFRQQLALDLPALNDALLDEVVTVLKRRRQRRLGATPAPCLGPAAAAWIASRGTRLECLGAPDPYAPSWSEVPVAVHRPPAATSYRTDGGRGRFRELYRQVLDRLRPTLFAVADAALVNGVLDHRDDLFFLPFELLDDLTVKSKPDWLSGAVLRNRSEYFGLLREADPELAEAWATAPLAPLA